MPTSAIIIASKRQFRRARHTFPSLSGIIDGKWGQTLLRPLNDYPSVISSIYVTERTAFHAYAAEKEASMAISWHQCARDAFKYA